MRSFVHLSNVWGDPQDSLALHSDFHNTVSELRNDNENVLVAVATEKRSLDALRHWRAYPEVQVAIFDAVNWNNANLEEIGVDCRGSSVEILRRADATLRAAGFRRAGRLWGEAGQSRRYRRPKNIRDTLGAIAAEMKIQVGANIVSFRDGRLSKAHRTAWVNKARVGLLQSRSRADVLDQNFGVDPPHRLFVDVNELVPPRSSLVAPSWSVDLDGEPSPLVTARSCFDNHGVWPISFSYPKEPLPIKPEPENLIAPIVPGLPYSFGNEATYLATYQRAYLGLTHRKAGWDCFRHVEIMASGALPWMPDASNIPEFSMIHYPKRGLHQVVEKFAAFGGPPDASTRMAFRDYFTRHLTSQAMIQYLLQATGLTDSGSILFIDELLPDHADYLSVLTVIGLKQLFGTACHVLHPVDYIYESSLARTQKLYGRGFGFSRLVSDQLRSSTELGYRNIDPSTFGALVIGSISRNWRVANDWLKQYPVERTIWLHGEDTPPTIDQAHALRTSGAHVFVRAIHERRR